jgi:hypothetical protein
MAPTTRRTPSARSPPCGWYFVCMCARVCAHARACVCAYARARACLCVRACVYVGVGVRQEGGGADEEIRTWPDDIRNDLSLPLSLPLSIPLSLSLPVSLSLSIPESPPSPSAPRTSSGCLPSCPLTQICRPPPPPPLLLQVFSTGRVQASAPVPVWILIYGRVRPLARHAPPLSTRCSPECPAADTMSSLLDILYRVSFHCIFFLS